MLVEHFHEVARSWPDALFLVSGNGRIIAANQAAKKVAGKEIEEIVGHKVFDLVSDPLEKVTRYLKACMRSREPIPGSLGWRSNGEASKCSCKGFVVTPLKGDAPGELLLHCRPAAAVSSKFIALNKTLEDLRISNHKLTAQAQLLNKEIAERKRLQENITRFNDKIATILDSLDAIVYVADMDTYEVLFANRKVVELFGEVEGRTCWKTLQGGQEGPCDFCTNRLLVDEKGIPKDVYVWEFKNTVTGRWFHVRDRAIRWVDDRVVRLEIATDITERRKTEEEVHRSLKEKEVLIKEIHHRVKNNLTIIISFLNLQARYLKDKETIGIFKESQNRIRTIALIHDQLYRSLDASGIDCGLYIPQLVENLSISLGVESRDIEFDVDAKGILDLNTAIPSGLIINELVTNSIKHAFPRRRSGTIRVRQIIKEDNLCLLVVSDDGVGFPEGFDAEKSGSLGLEIVRVLVRQISGTLSFKSNGGLSATISFRMDNKTA